MVKWSGDLWGFVSRGIGVNHVDEDLVRMVWARGSAERDAFSVRGVHVGRGTMQVVRDVTWALIESCTLVTIHRCCKLQIFSTLSFFSTYLFVVQTSVAVGCLAFTISCRL